MINAAEPVEASSIDIFYAVFGKYGLHDSKSMYAFSIFCFTLTQGYPYYGMNILLLSEPL